MSQEQIQLAQKTQQLLHGPLKHVRAAALAAALLPLASVAVAPAAAQTVCPLSGGVCGVVFNDADNDGFQDVGETGLEGIKVFVCQLCDGTDTIPIETGPGGFFEVLVPQGPTTIAVLIPTEKQTSPNDCCDETFDSDGVQIGAYSVVKVQENGSTTDFGFSTPPIAGPGTGTPGYWKNHPEAWPESIRVSGITVGGRTYTKAEAIAALGKVGKDKTYTMFSSLVPAMLNLLIGNLDCVSSTIAGANSWLATYPLGSNVAGSSYAWSIGEPMHQLMDSYNNGRLCAAHRQ